MHCDKLLNKGFAANMQWMYVRRPSSAAVPCCFLLHVALQTALESEHCLIETGEVRADEGEASICGSSVHKDLHSAQQLTGYCPQFDGLPGQMTGASSAINSLQPKRFQS